MSKITMLSELDDVTSKHSRIKPTQAMLDEIDKCMTLWEDFEEDPCIETAVPAFRAERKYFEGLYPPGDFDGLVLGEDAVTTKAFQILLDFCEKMLKSLDKE